MEKHARKSRGEEMSVMTGDSTQFTVSNSIATDPNASAGVVKSGYRGNSNVILNAAAGPKSPLYSGGSNNNNNMQVDYNAEDPDFDEALRIQLRANKLLASKRYKAAIEEYTAALFLVPDDPNLSPDLHMGRAHALNGSRRHESARNDAVLAIRLNPSPAAFSTLAKSLFYMKDYRGSIEAFRQCLQVLPRGEGLGMFDKAYLQKAEAALAEEEASLRAAGMAAPAPKLPVPKLPPPRFVPREEAIQSTPSLPPMPNHWPQQSPHSPSALKFGPEREVMFISEALGIKLNRGSDGIVRVLSVSPNTPSSPVARNGRIEAGDVVREAVGVDIRRPITNIMWGDTVALIKMAPRPIILTVAKELSEVPPTVAEEMRRALYASPSGTPSSVFRPSPSSGDGSTKDLVNTQQATVSPFENSPTEDGDAVAVANTPHDAVTDAPSVAATEVEEPSAEVVIPSLLDEEEEEDADEEDVAVVVGHTAGIDRSEAEPSDKEPSDAPPAPEGGDTAEIEESEAEPSDNEPSDAPPEPEGVDTGEIEQCKAEPNDKEPSDAPPEPEKSADSLNSIGTDEPLAATAGSAGDDIGVLSGTEASPDDTPVEGSLRDEEARVVHGEILFSRTVVDAYNGWDSLRWMSYSGVRKVQLYQSVFRFVGKKKNLFWTATGTGFAKRKLIIYEEPNVILVVRSPNEGEIATLLDISDASEIAEAEKAAESYHVVESVIEPQTCKLRLAPLTTVTSLAPEGANERRRSCFELVTPVETIVLSAVHVRNDAKKVERSFADSGAFLETFATETAVAKALCKAHANEEDIGKLDTEIMWKHQIVLGTLHSHVLSGNQKILQQAIQYAVAATQDDDTKGSLKPGQLPSKIIDARDENGHTALYYACSRRMAPAVSALTNAGADVNFKIHPTGLTPCHICARNLDDKSLSTILAATGSARPDPNALDSSERTPMYVAVIEGHTVSGGHDSVALERCMMALEAWGGQMMISETMKGVQRPVGFLASEWRPDDLSVVLDHLPFRYPLQSSDILDTTPLQKSVSAYFLYPLHSCLIGLRREMKSLTSGKKMAPESTLIHTIRVLFEHGFEPNERIEDDTELGEFVGFTPIQVVASIALEFEAAKDRLEMTNPGLYSVMQSLIADAAECLVRNGARIGVDAPPLKRLRRRESLSNASSSGASGASGDEDASEGSSTTDVNRSCLKLETNKQALELLGGVNRLNLAKKEWAAIKSITATRQVTLWQDDKQSIPDSNAAGGSSEKSCAICWKAFGILNRKHRCRVLKRHVCDDCSTKRLVEGGVENRVSDGQFLLAAVDAGKAASERLQAKSEHDRIQDLQTQKSHTALRLERLEAEENSNRDSLFGGMLEQASNYVFGEEEDAKRPARQVEGLASSLGETRDALNKRGEQLASLNDKSAQMVDASADFARMAKELRKKSEAGWFG